MRIAATIQYGELCRQLRVDAIPGLGGDGGERIRKDRAIHLRAVTVDDDDAKARLIELDEWEDEPIWADDPAALREFVAALLSRDLASARIYADRLFADDRMRVECERLLSPAQAVGRAA